MSKVAQFAEVAPAVPLPATGPQTYTYRLSSKQQSKINLYTRVTVLFGRQKVSGVVTQLHSRRRPYPIKPLTKIFSSSLTTRQVKFARWIAKVSHGGLGYTLRLFQLPGGKTYRSPSSVIPAPPSSNPPSQAIIDSNLARRQAKLKTIIKRHLRRGHQVLILVPEKWMTQDLSSRLSALSPTFMYSDLSSARLSVAWRRVHTGQAKLIIGTQKSLFLPFTNLGLIIIEEEQYSTHKLWDQYPRLHNVPSAEYLASLHKASLLYTSSFPSLRLRQALQDKKINALSNRPLSLHPSLVEYDFTDKIKRYVLPASFVTKLKQWLKNKEEILLFYNQLDNTHLKKILAQNYLTSHRLTLSTSAIFAAAPGKKFDRIVWLNPERILNYPDFRSHERSLIILSRLQQSFSNPRRHIFLVTRQAANVAAVLTTNPVSVFRSILQERRRFDYPPYTQIVRLTIKAKTKQAALKRGALIRQQIDQHVSQEKITLKVRGPFHDLSRLTKAKPEAHLLLAGALPDLINTYQNLAVDAADLMPERIL